MQKVPFCKRLVGIEAVVEAQRSRIAERRKDEGFSDACFRKIPVIEQGFLLYDWDPMKIDEIMQRLTEVCQLMHYSYATEKCYQG